MRQHARIGDAVVSWLDSAPSPSDLEQGFVPASPADAAQAFSPANVLVLVHAFPMNAQMWTAQIQSVPPGWRYLAPDLPGFGQSDPQGGADPLSLDDYARAILALLDRLALDRFVVAGLSMGGYTAFSLLRLAPARIRGVVLSNTRADADSPEARKGRAEMIALLERAGVEAVAELMLPRLLGETTRNARPDLTRLVRATAEANSFEGVRQAIVRMMNRPDSTPLLGDIRCPALVVASDEDSVIPIDQARTMQQRIPGARFAGIPGAGHLSNLERPDHFNEALTRFVTTHCGG